MLFICYFFGTFRRHFYQICHWLKFASIIQFVFHVIDAFSHWKSSLFFPHPVRWQMACLEFHHYRSMLFSGWKEMVRLPEKAALWAGGQLILWRLVPLGILFSWSLHVSLLIGSSAYEMKFLPTFYSIIIFEVYPLIRNCRVWAADKHVRIFSRASKLANSSQNVRHSLHVQNMQISTLDVIRCVKPSSHLSIWEE